MTNTQRKAIAAALMRAAVYDQQESDRLKSDPVLFESIATDAVAKGLRQRAESTRILATELLQGVIR